MTTSLRQHMHDAMRVSGFALRTQRGYLEAITKLARFYRVSPQRLTPAQIEAWLLHLIDERKLYGNASKIAGVSVLLLMGSQQGRLEQVAPFISLRFYAVSYIHLYTQTLPISSWIIPGPA